MINFAQNFRKMSKLIHMNNEYAEWVKSLSLRFRQSQIKASVKVNSEMLRFYWSLGRDIVENSMDNKYGSGFFNNLSNDLKDSLPGVKGFSPRNLAYMKSFYVLYSPLISQQPQEAGGNEFLQQVVAKFKTLDSGRDKLPQVADNSSDSQILQQVVAKLAESIFSIPWGHHTLIINRCMNQPEKALFFTQKTIENGWSRNVLLNFLDTDLYERQGKAITNFTKTWPSPLSDLAQELTRDPYVFDYAQVREKYDEAELKEALMANIQKLLLELGNGFAFMGKEYRMVVGGDELYCDMLFYNTHIHSYIITEVKTQKFEPSFLGQLSGYVSCANHILKREGDNDTIGLLICKSKNEVMARYSLEGFNQPLGISEYELSKVFPKDFKGSLPSIEDIENELK